MVLLILAMVAIGTLQESNIIGHAQNAAGSFNQAKVNEISLLEQYEKEIEDNLPKQEEVVWGEYQGGLMYIGNNKDVKITSNFLLVEEMELNETQNGLNKTGKTKQITLSDVMVIDLGIIETIDFGNKITKDIIIFGYSTGKIREIKGLEGVTTFYNDAFATCKNLKFIEFPSTLTTIETNAFQSTNLTKITIPVGVTSIASNAFSGCTSLTEVIINKTKAEVEAEGGIGTDWIPESVTKIIYNDVTVTR